MEIETTEKRGVLRVPTIHRVRREGCEEVTDNAVELLLFTDK